MKGTTRTQLKSEDGTLALVCCPLVKLAYLSIISSFGATQSV